jgi:hypothetical protein
MMETLGAILKFGDVDTKFGFAGAIAAPILSVMMSALLIVADFGVLLPPVPADVSLRQASAAITAIKDDTPKNAVSSLYLDRDGIVETRMVLRTANGRDVFYGAVTVVFWMIVSALACLVSGAAVALRLLQKPLDVQNDRVAALTYKVARVSARVATVCCTMFIIWGLYVTGFGPILDRIF